MAIYEHHSNLHPVEPYSDPQSSKFHRNALLVANSKLSSYAISKFCGDLSGEIGHSTFEQTQAKLNDVLASYNGFTSSLLK